MKLHQRASNGRGASVYKKPSKELFERIRATLAPLAPEARNDVLGAVQLSLDAIVSMPSHTRVRPDASARQSLLQMHFELLGFPDEKITNNLCLLSNELAEYTPRDLTYILERLRIEFRVQERLGQVPLQSRFGVVVAIQAYFYTLISISAPQADAETLHSVLMAWSTILGLSHDLESLSQDVPGFSPQDGADFFDSLRAEMDASPVQVDGEPTEHR